MASKCIFCGKDCGGACLFDGGNEITPAYGTPAPDWEEYKGMTKAVGPCKKKCYVCGKEWVEALDGHFNKKYPNECRDCVWKYRKE